MVGRLLPGLLLAALLGGCVGVTDGPSTFTGLEALREAQTAKPGLELFSLRGLEGWRPGPPSAYLGLMDDGLPDGVLGDGRLSSWVASFVTDDGLLEVQVFADGREPALRHHEVPPVTLDSRVFLSQALAIPDSDAAARAAFTSPAFDAHAASYPEAGFLYTFAKDPLDYAFASDERNDRIDFVGWPTVNRTWSVAHFAADGAQPMVRASVAGDGTLLDVAHETPMDDVVLIDEKVALPSPVPPALAPTAYVLNFTVAPGTRNLTGFARVSPDFFGEFRVRVLTPDGSTAYDSEDDPPTYGEFSTEAPSPGTWAVEATRVTRVLPIPDLPPAVVIRFDRVLEATIEADVPVLALA